MKPLSGRQFRMQYEAMVKSGVSSDYIRRWMLRETALWVTKDGGEPSSAREAGDAADGDEPLALT